MSKSTQIAQPASSASQPQRKKIKPKVEKQLYVRAGGRCHICNTYLLESTDIGYYQLNRGEMAHIVGQSQGPKSPRGNHSLAKELRDEVDNLLLLCADHHHTIDDVVARGDYTVEQLHEIKRRHEDRILHVTGLSAHSSNTTIVRMLGSIRGYTTHLTRAECNSATIWHNPSRFADFALDINRQGTEINLVPFDNPEGDVEFYYKNVRKCIDSGLKYIRQGIAERQIEHLSIFGFARIPALVYLGFSLGNKVGNTLFQRRRVDDKHWHWQVDAPTHSFEWQLIQAGNDSKRVAVILNVSGTIHPTELPEHIDDSYYVFLITVIGITPSPDVILSVESLDNFRLCYRQWLAHLENGHKLAPEIHCFSAIPCAIAIACGLDLMPNAHPALVVYDRMPRDFAIALTVNE
ncbi:SAVED domain-containing protein [Hymenobacter defluvii]|uniref:SAVED domain-containing protein n=1 Tax=Hymenobacter defluvii TaxID=2054411 RepID=A0ABS3TEE1_9BACT|nr:SAVED domain-containing protein [Hymenobacter defluvii]MBO3272022.1 SAVED domain-containing protein [Hymenobacter defluvii]